MSEHLTPEAGAAVPAGHVDLARAEAAVRELLLAVGEDPDREGLQETPARVARAYAETFAGLYQFTQWINLLRYIFWTEILHRIKG